MFQRIQQKVTATKTPHEKLIEWLEKRGLKEKTDNFKNDLTSLDLGNNQIGNSGAKEIATVLKTNSTITMLDLYGNEIGDIGVKEIASALKTNSSITKLVLGGNNIGESEVNEIDRYLQRNRALTEKKAEGLNVLGDDLYIQEKYFEAVEKYKAAIKIKKELESYKYNKKNLYEENKAKAEKKYEEQQKQLESNKLNETVNNFFNNSSELNICYQTISDDLAKLTANRLRDNETITTVNFSNSEISDAGIKIISKSLKANKQLKNFDFSCNNLGNQKISLLTEILQINTISYFYLGENKIDNIGIKAIIEALKSNNNNITHLDLHNNNIGNEGVKLIAEFLRDNRTLKHLDIALNNITDDGIKEIIESLRENTAITYIDLTVNNISNTNQILIEKYLQRNKYLVEKNNKFKKLTDELNTKIASEANIKDKATIENTINDILQKTKLLVSKTDIELIATSMQELLGNKLLKSKFIAIDEQLDELIEQQNTDEHISVLGDDAIFG